MAEKTTNGKGSGDTRLQWLRRINDAVSTATRQVFQSAPSVQRNRRFGLTGNAPKLPELEPILELVRFPSTCVTGKKRKRHIRFVRDILRDPKVQWLSRSSIESGVCNALCRELLSYVENARSQEQEADVAHGDAVAAMICHIILDSLLSTCDNLMGKCSVPCQWKFLEKPPFHAMPCFSRWETLLPLLQRLAVEEPAILDQVVQCYTVVPMAKVNCYFAHAYGLCRLLETLAATDSDLHSQHAQTSSTILSFIINKRVLRIVQEEDELSDSTASFDDLLFSKFFHYLQNYLVISKTAKNIASQALVSSLVSTLKTSTFSMSKTMRIRCGYFATTACIQISEFPSLMIEQVLAMVDARGEGEEDAASSKQLAILGFLSNLCAHVDNIELANIFQVLQSILACYQQKQIDEQTRLAFLFLILYVAVHRYKLLPPPAVFNEDNDFQVQASIRALQLQRTKFQDHVLVYVEYEDFYLMPVHWMQIFWQHWFLLLDADIQSFLRDAIAFQVDRTTNVQTPKRAWKHVLRLLPLRKHLHPASVNLGKIIYPHLVQPVPFEPLSSNPEMQSRKHFIQQECKRQLKRRRVETFETEEEMTRKLNVLLLPDIMERVCSYLTAKRLCRMSLVSRDFYPIVQNPQVWKHVWFQLTKDFPVVCHHGPCYVHDWKEMYKERLRSVSKLRKGPLVSRRKPVHATTDSAFDSSSDPNQRRLWKICTVCGCNRILSTPTKLLDHLEVHEQFTCTDESCRASFTSKKLWTEHIKSNHTLKEMDAAKQTKDDSGKFLCGFPGCKKVYTSVLWLQKHREKQGHFASEETNE